MRKRPSVDGEAAVYTDVSIPCIVYDRLELHTDDVEAFLADVSNYDIEPLDDCPCCGRNGRDTETRPTR